MAEGQVDNIIHSLRKSEVRTPFTNELLAATQEYFGEMLRQSNPPQLVQQFVDRRGIILPIGSVLRGTARPATSDLDLLLAYDGEGQESIDRPGHHTVEGLVDNSEDVHPSHIPFSTWFARKCKNDPQLLRYYEEKKKLLQRNIDQANLRRASNEVSPRELTEERIEKAFLFVEAQSFDTHALSSDTIRLASLSQVDFEQLAKDREISGPLEHHIRFSHYIDDLGLLIPHMLTTTDDLTVEGTPNSLLHQQRKIVQALAVLEETNPFVFQVIYTDLEKYFRASTLYEGGNHGIGSSYYDSLLREYVEKSGKFPQDKTERAARLLKAVKRQVIFPTFQAMKDKYL